MEQTSLEELKRMAASGAYRRIPIRLREKRARRATDDGAHASV